MKNLLSGFRRSPHPDREQLSEYLDGEASPKTKGVLEAHISSCAQCRSQLDGLREVRSALGALPQAEAPRSFRLQSWQVEHMTPHRRAAAGFVYAVPALGIAAAVALVVLVGVDLSGSGGNHASPAASNFAFNRAPPPGAEATFSKDLPSAPSIASSGAAVPASPMPTPPSAMLQDNTERAPAAPATSSATPSDASAFKEAQGAPSPTAVAADQARSAPPTAAAASSSQQQAPSNGSGTDWLRIGEIIAGCVAVVAAVATVGVLKLRRSPS